MLEGSVRRDVGRLRVTAQLIDAASGYHLWSHSYDRDVGGTLSLQTDIAGAVANALEVTLLGNQTDRLTAGGTSNPTALDAFLRGMNMLRVFDARSPFAALAAFSEAVRLDPAYADALAGRAKARADIAGFGFDGQAEPVKLSLSGALGDANKAVALADLSGFAHAARGYVLQQQYDLRAAASEYSRALQLDPGRAETQSRYAELQTFLGHRAEAVAIAQRAVSLDPLNADAYRSLGYALAYARRYDESLTALRHAQALTPPGTLIAIDMIATVHLFQGRPQDTMQDSAGKTDWWDLQCVAIAAHQLGHPADAQDALGKLHDTIGNRGAYQYAEIYAQWGDPQAALKWLNIAYGTQDVGMMALRVDPLLDPLRAMPAFDDLERKLDFPS